MKPCGVPSRARGAGDDRVEQASLSRRGPAGRARSRRARAGTGRRGRRPAAPARVAGLDEVQRAVCDRDELVLGASVVREAGDAGADRHGRTDDRARPIRDGPADPVGDLVGDDTVGAGQDRRELVAAVAIEPVAVAGRRGSSPGRRPSAAHRPPDGPCVSLKALNASRSSISTANGRPAVHGVAQLALERTVVAQPGQGVLLRPHLDGAVGLRVLEGDRRLAGEQLGELELVGAERGRARPSGRCSACRSPRPPRAAGTTIIDSGSNGVPGTWTERGSRWAWLDRTASRWSMTQPVRPLPIGPSSARIISAKSSRAMTARRIAGAAPRGRSSASRTARSP